MKQKRFLGIFVNPYMVQSEGLQQVFDNLESIGVSAIALSPRVGRPVAEGQGKRIPILHIDGYRRLLARPVWERQEFFIQQFPGDHCFNEGIRPASRWNCNHIIDKLGYWLT